MFILYNLFMVDVDIFNISRFVLLMLFSFFMCIIPLLGFLQYKAMGRYSLIELWWVLPYIWIVFDFVYVGSLGLNPLAAAPVGHLGVFSLYAIAYMINRLHILSKRRLLQKHALICTILAICNSLLFMLFAVYADHCLFPPLYWAILPMYYNATPVVLLAVSAVVYTLLSMYMVFCANPVVAEYFVYINYIFLIFALIFFSGDSFYSLLVYIFIWI